MTEEELFHCYRNIRVTVPCACGGTVTADPNNPIEVYGAVSRHQDTEEHRRWRSTTLGLTTTRTESAA
jgi:hypothetical protein